MQDDLLRLLDLRVDDVAQLLGASGPGDDVHIAGVAPDAPSPESDFAYQKVRDQADEGDEEDDRQPSEVDRRLRLAADDDRQHDQPDQPLDPEEDARQGQHRPPRFRPIDRRCPGHQYRFRADMEPASFRAGSFQKRTWPDRSMVSWTALS